MTVLRDSDRVQTWVEVEVIAPIQRGGLLQPAYDPGPLGIELVQDFMGGKTHLAYLSRETIDADGTRHYWRRVR